MGQRNRDRELREARTAYIAAVRRLDVALRRFDVSGIPMEPGPQPEPYPWSRTHIEIIREVTAAFAAVCDRRREWDGMRREWTSPH